MEGRYVSVIDNVLVVVTLLMIIVLVGYSTPQIIFPVDEKGRGMSDEKIFSVQDSDVLLIDDSLDFSDPEEYQIEDNLRIRLDAGTHHLKFVRQDIDRINVIDLKDDVTLEFKREGDIFHIINGGDIPLVVDVFDQKKVVKSSEIVSGKKSENGGEI